MPSRDLGFSPWKKNIGKAEKVFWIRSPWCRAFLLIVEFLWYRSYCFDTGKKSAEKNSCRLIGKSLLLSWSFPISLQEFFSADFFSVSKQYDHFCDRWVGPYLDSELCLHNLIHSWFSLHYQIGNCVHSSIVLTKRPNWPKFLSIVMVAHITELLDAFWNDEWVFFIRSKEAVISSPFCNTRAGSISHIFLPLWLPAKIACM